jgi:hypothetical protein
VTTTLADGSVGTVLDLPAGATAVSPPMCVSSDYPDARVDVRQLSNGPGMKMSVAYTGGKSEGQSAGAVNGGSTCLARDPTARRQPVRLAAGPVHVRRGQGRSPALRLLRRPALLQVGDLG